MNTTHSATPDDGPGLGTFACEIRPERGRVRLLVRGSLDMASVPALEARVEELRRAGTRQLLLDLSRLAFIDSSGLRSVLRLDAEARQDGFTLSLVRGSDAVHRVFELTRTAPLLPFVSE